MRTTVLAQARRAPGLTLAILCLITALAMLPLLGSGLLSTPASALHAPDLAAFGQLPLAFVPGRYSSGSGAVFEAYGAGSQLTFTSQGIAMHLPGSMVPLQVKFVAANPAPELEADVPLPMKINEYRGSAPAGWRTNLPAYATIDYRELYPGIDLHYEGQDGALKSTFTVAPGADPGSIRWQYSGATGVAVDQASGDLLVTLPDESQVVEKAPLAWQEFHGRKVAVPVAFAAGRKEGAVSFAVGSYDHAAPLVIDPTFVYEKTLNLGGFDYGFDTAIDAAGNAYVLGRVYDSNNDVLIAKFSPSGTLLYVTYLRGSRLDYGGGITLDDAGDVYVGGFTDSPDFPILNAMQSKKNGVTRDAFVTKLAAEDGSLQFSTFFGGSRSDEIHDLTLNGDGDIYLVGYTESTDFPTLNPIQGNLNLNQCFCEDTFVTKLSPDGLNVLYSTYLGGSFEDYGESIALDAAENIYITGHTQSDDFPTQAALQGERAGEFQDEDVFVTKIAADGSALAYSTYLGGADLDNARRLAVNSAGNAYVAGYTRSADFPTTTGAYREDYIGGALDCGVSGFGGPVNCYDMFAAKFAPDGSALVYSTYLGGGLDDVARGVAVDGAGEAFLIGYTQSTDFPGVTRTGPGADIALAKLNASGSELLYTVIIESGTANAGHGIGLDDAGAVYITGSQTDLYVAKLSDGGSTPPTETPTAVPPTATPTDISPTASPTDPGPTATPTDIPPTVTPTEPSPTVTPSEETTLHVGDLDGDINWISGKKIWQGAVTIAVHDAGENPVSGATITGTWDEGQSSMAQCTTGSGGSCTLTSGDISRPVWKATFSVDNVEHPALTYAPSENHDSDGDSSGTSIVVSVR